jgi:muconolactone delta-isomerase
MCARARSTPAADPVRAGALAPRIVPGTTFDRRPAVRPVKFLVTWQLELALLSREMGAAIARVPEYAAELERRGKVIARYHIVGAHGGVWIFDVDSHEELERLLGGSPAFNFSHYDVKALSDMSG